MDLKYKVIIADDAQKDIDELFTYIYNVLGTARSAERIVTQIVKSINSLCIFPYQGISTDFYAKDGTSYRKLIVENYVAFYLVYDETKEIKIIRVFDGRTNYHI